MHKNEGIFKSYGYLFHGLAMGIIIVSLFIRLEHRDILHVLTVLTIILPPGLFLLGLIKNIKMLFPFMFGAALSIGLIFHGVLSFALTIVNLDKYYEIIAIVFSVLSVGVIYFTKAYIRVGFLESTFDLLDLIIYIALFLGLGMFSRTYGNLFDSLVVKGLIESPLLEVHSIGFANYVLNYNEYPFFSMFGWPIIPVAQPYKIPHLPMAGFIIKGISVWCRGNILFGLYLSYLLILISLLFTQVVLCSLLFNRYAALLIVVAFSLQLMPSMDPSYLLYYPVLLSLMGAQIFILITIDQDSVISKSHKHIYMLECIIFIFLLLVHNQFLIVFISALMVYFLFKILSNGHVKDAKIYVLQIILLIVVFYISLLQNRALYPSLELTKWDPRRAVLELELFSNIGYLYPKINDGLMPFVKTVFRYDFFYVVCGIIIFIKYIYSFERLQYKSVHVFIWSGILMSIIFGNIFNFEAGKSSLLFFAFSIYFLFIYGGEALSFNRYFALFLAGILIAGFVSYPQFYRYYYHGNGSIAKQEYIDLRMASSNLPTDAIVLLLSENYSSLYIGYEADELQNSKRRTQRSCEMLTGHRCVFQDAKDIIGHPEKIKEMGNMIATHRITHIITDVNEPIWGKLLRQKIINGINISANDKYKILSIERNKNFY